MSRIKEFTLPDLGEGLTEGEILSWLVKVGDTIELNQPIVEVETAKAAVEIPAKWGGVVTQIHHEAGTTVEVGAPIISIDTDPSRRARCPSAESLAAVEIAPEEGAVEPGLIGGPAPGGRTAVLVGYGPKTVTAKSRPRIGTPARPQPQPPTPPAAAAAPAPAPSRPQPRPRSAAPAARAVAPGSGLGPVLAKPPVRKLAKDLGVDLSTIVGTGPLGSVTRDDVQRGSGRRSPFAGRCSRGRAGAVFDASREQRIPIKGVRKLTAENMVASAFTAPHVTEFLTVDVTRSMKALERLKARPEFARRPGLAAAVRRQGRTARDQAAPDGQLDLVRRDQRDRGQGLRQPRHRGGHRRAD